MDAVCISPEMHLSPLNMQGVPWLGLTTFTLPEYWSGNIFKATLGWSYLHQKYFPDPRFFSTLWLMTQETQPFSLLFTIPSAILNILYLFNFSLQNVQISLLYLSSSTNRQICLSNFLQLLLGIGVRAGEARGGCSPPQSLDNSDFLGSKRKFGQSQFLKTFPCFLSLLLFWRDKYFLF